MVSFNCYNFFRGLRSIFVPFITVIGLTLTLTYVFILYHPGRGPGLAQKMGWQSWEVIETPSTNTSHGASPGTQPSHNHGTDWWNVSVSTGKVDSLSFPLDVWAPLLPHDTGCRYVLHIRDADFNW